MTKSIPELIDVTVMQFMETERAILVSDTDDGKRVWLPKSQIEVERKKNNTIIVTLPLWLAKEKELI